MAVKAQTHIGDCLDVLLEMQPESVDLIYVDPPFFTQKVHDLVTRDGSASFSFRDIWESDSSYADFIYQRIARARDVLKSSGSLFFHCDKSASHIVRLMLDSIFSPDHFQSEIIWHFKRWSNAKKGLLPAHQTIFFYSKTDKFKFNTFYQEYSPSTNVDQIMQKRVRDERNKSVYARNESGKVVGNGSKKGVPLSDVWEIPFLNPKAKERVGYPTQKPVLLMNKIIELVTEKGDVVLDPFCGSGTTLVAAQLLNRSSIGIDIAEEAIELTKSRLENPVVTGSALLEKGKESYRQHDAYASSHMIGIDYMPVHRNKGIDGLLKQEIDGLPVFVRVQRDGENIGQTAAALKKAAKNKGDCSLVVIATCDDLLGYKATSDVHLIPSTSFAITELIGRSSQVSRQELAAALTE
jgi:site-specific DNA-methyltransferase (adenine-specific)